jgi:hypothetical protein
MLRLAGIVLFIAVFLFPTGATQIGALDPTPARSQAGCALSWQLPPLAQSFAAHGHSAPQKRCNLNHRESAGADSSRSRGPCAGLSIVAARVFLFRTPIVPLVGHFLWTAGLRMILAGEAVQL